MAMDTVPPNDLHHLSVCWCLAKSMDEQEISKVETWLARMRVNVERALDLADKLSSTELDESNPLFWALAKLAENVEESIVQLNNLNTGIYECLIEIPVSGLPDQSEQLSWEALKGMRNRLAHQFWDIDADILWRTVTEDFKKLNLLLNSLRVIRDLHRGTDDISVTISREDFNRLPISDEGQVGPMELGHSIAFLFFEEDGAPKGLRVGRSHDDNPLWSASPGRGGIRITLRG